MRQQPPEEAQSQQAPSPMSADGGQEHEQGEEIEGQKSQQAGEAEVEGDLEELIVGVANVKPRVWEGGSRE